MKIRNKNILFLIIALVVIAILFIWLSARPKPVKIIRVSPLSESQNIDPNTQILVLFSQKVDLGQVHFTINPKTLLQKSTQDQETIIFIPEQPLKGNQIYRISVWYQKENPTTWEFKTKIDTETPSIPLYPSPGVETTPTSTQSNSSQIKNKIISQLPVETENYSIQYLSKNDQFFITIKKSPYDTYKSQVIIWFKNFGISRPEEDLPLFFTSSRWVTP